MWGFFVYMASQKNLILLRGLPGSGKSSLAKILSEDGAFPMFSVDDYFTNPQTGDYQFDYKTNHMAYKQCEENCKKAMESGSQKIFIHNTFTIDWEMEPYFKLAKEFSYKLFVLTLENYHGNGNTHGVSEEQLLKMAEKYKVKLY